VGVQFRLGRPDHQKVEDFLSRRPAGVSGIVLDPKWSRYERPAAEVARSVGVDVYFDPATERLVAPGFELAGIPYFAEAPYDVNRLAGDARARARLVERVLEAHPSETSAVTPPHFLVQDDRSANLNLVLAEDMRNSTHKPVRATLVLGSRFGARVAPGLALQYAEAGIRQIELRITPLGGDEESLAKIRSAFAVADAFSAAELSVTLGLSGNIGQAAVALGHVEHYSVGIGMLERVDHAAALSRQKAPSPEGGEGGEGPRGAVAGIYLPGAAATVSRTAGAALLDHSDIRLRLGCRLGECGSSLAGPMKDPRAHYLHARAHEMEQVLSQPSRWRATREIDRLRRAIELREIVNLRYRLPGVPELKTRTLRSLIDNIQGEQAAQTA
jgi:hypothetical protein